MATGATSLDQLPSDDKETVQLHRSEIPGDRFAEEIASLGAQGVLQVPQCDVPTDDVELRMDKQADPVYIPDVPPRKHAERHSEYIPPTTESRAEEAGELWSDLRGPMLAGLVCLVLSSSTVGRFMRRTMPSLYSPEGDMIPLALGVMSAMTVGLCYVGERALDSFVSS